MRAWRSLDIGDKVRFKTRDDSPGLLCTVIEKGETHVLVESDLYALLAGLMTITKRCSGGHRNGTYYI